MYCIIFTLLLKVSMLQTSESSVKNKEKGYMDYTKTKVKGTDNKEDLELFEIGKEYDHKTFLY